VNEYDIFVSKLSSKKKKHQDDLRVLALKLDRDIARSRLVTDGRSFLDDLKLKPQIEENWRFIFQEPLIVEQATTPVQREQRPSRDPTGTTPGKVRPKRSRKNGRDKKQ
jgi:hypothetical protein